jgi:hypothetical protein
LLEKIGARDGIEPPPPAFLGLAAAAQFGSAQARSDLGRQNQRSRVGATELWSSKSVQISCPIERLIRWMYPILLHSNGIGEFEKDSAQTLETAKVRRVSTTPHHL